MLIQLDDPGKRFPLNTTVGERCAIERKRDGVTGEDPTSTVLLDPTVRSEFAKHDDPPRTSDQYFRRSALIHNQNEYYNQAQFQGTREHGGPAFMVPSVVFMEDGESMANSIRISRPIGFFLVAVTIIGRLAAAQWQKEAQEQARQARQI